MAESIGVGMLGYGFMGRAHSHALRTLAHMAWPPPLEPKLVAIAGRDGAAVADAARAYGFDRHVTDWRELLADDGIRLFDNTGPNALHAEPTIAAAESGRHVVCEKPLGRDAAEAHETWRAVEATGVTHLCAFNYRFMPAVRLAREIVDAGRLGAITHFRVAYLQDWGAAADEAAWRFDREAAGSGALGDLAAHAVDLARYLVGEIETVSALAATFRPGREVDDAVAAAIGFTGGAVGTLEATRFATGRRNALRWEINGARGSLAFDVERLNELQVHDAEAGPGFRTVLVTEPDHPFVEHWWPPGHILGWGDSFVHELHHVLAAIRDGRGAGPQGATFEDGYRAAEVCDAILRSARSGARETVSHR